MGEVRRKYTREFKIEALRLISDEGLSFAKVARDLGVNETMLYRWRSELSEDPKEAFPGQDNLKPQDEELRRLRRELEIVKKERENFFSKPSVSSRGNRDEMQIHLGT